MWKQLISCFIMEFVASFLVVFYSTAQNDLDKSNTAYFNSLCLLFIIMPMIWISQRISGGHLNPFLSVASLILGKCSFGVALTNSLGQFSGGFVGIIFLRILQPQQNHSMYINTTLVDIVVFETLVVFFLTLVFLITNFNSKITRAIHGFAVPAVYAAGNIAAASLYGGRFNPAWYVPIYLFAGTDLLPVLVMAGVGSGVSVVTALLFKFVYFNKKKEVHETSLQGGTKELRF